jgi:hypothetical protein
LSCCAPTVIRIGRVGDCDPHQALGMPQTSPVPSVYQLQGQQSSSKLNNKKNTTLIRTPTSPLASPKYRHHLQQDNPVSRRQTISTVQVFFSSDEETTICIPRNGIHYLDKYARFGTRTDHSTAVKFCVYQFW